MKKYLKLITPEKLILRLATSWMLVSLVVLLIDRNSDIEKILISANTVLSVCCMAGVFLLLCLMQLKEESVYSEKKLLFYSMMLFFGVSLSVSEIGNGIDFKSSALFALEAIILALTARYVFEGDIPYSGINKSKCKKYLAVTAVLIGLYIFVADGSRYLAFECETWDFGIFNQMFANMRSTLIPYTTCERNELMSHFAIHISPVYYLMLPFYAVVPSPLTLLLFQSAAVMSGVIPLYLICRRFNQGDMITFAACLVYLLHPVTACSCTYDMHENFFLAPFILWLFYFIETKKTLPIYIFALLTLSVKEDAAIYVASIAVFVFFEKKQRVLGASLFAIACAWFVAAIALLSFFGDGTLAMAHYSNFGDSFFRGFLTTLIAYPSYIISQIISDENKIGYILQVLIPLSFLPVINKKITRYMLMIPFVVINLIVVYKAQYSIFYQYSIGSFACLIYLFVLNLPELKKDTKRIVCAFSVAACIVLSVATTTKMTADIPTYISNYDTITTMWETAKSIPQGVSVAASQTIVPYLSNHTELYSINQGDKYDKVDYDYEFECQYVVLDIRIAKNNYYYCDPKVFEYYLNNSQYELVKYNKGASAVFALKNS